MNDSRWEDARRLEAWAGEVRVNMIRAAGLAAFYGYHLLNVYLLTDDATLRLEYNAKVTAVVAGWAVAVFALHVCLTRRWVPPALKYVAVAWDLLMVTALLLVHPKAGPHSPLVVLYFPIVASASMRLSLKLVYAATLGAMAAATLMMGFYIYGVVGSAAYYDPSTALQAPRSSEVIFLLALGATGLVAGQAVRQARRLVAGYPVKVLEPGEAA